MDGKNAPGGIENGDPLNRRQPEPHIEPHMRIQRISAGGCREQLGTIDVIGDGNGSAVQVGPCQDAAHCLLETKPDDENQVGGVQGLEVLRLEQVLMRVLTRTHQGVNLDAVTAHNLDSVGDDTDRRDDLEAPGPRPVADTAADEEASSQDRQRNEPDYRTGLQAQRRQTCATRKVTTRPIATGITVATVVHLTLPVSL